MILLAVDGLTRIAVPTTITVIGRGTFDIMSRIVFITGTDTGVGKTVVTCLLVAYLRKQGQDAVAIKPVCSGGREDIRQLRRAQQEALTEEEICPFYFDAPVTPMLAARRAKRRIGLARAMR